MFFFFLLIIRLCRSIESLNYWSLLIKFKLQNSSSCNTILICNTFPILSMFISSQSFFFRHHSALFSLFSYSFSNSFLHFCCWLIWSNYTCFNRTIFHVYTLFFLLSISFSLSPRDRRYIRSIVGDQNERNFHCISMSIPLDDLFDCRAMKITIISIEN